MDRETVYKSKVYDGVQTRVTREGTTNVCDRYRVEVERVDLNVPVVGSGLPDILDIRFQNGPVKHVGINGIPEEGLLLVLCHRFRLLHESSAACTEYAKVLQHLEEAHDWLVAHQLKTQENKS